jgi:hypothetical protein
LCFSSVDFFCDRWRFGSSVHASPPRSLYPPSVVRHGVTANTIHRTVG